MFTCIMSISASSDNTSKYEQNQLGRRSFLTEYLTQRVTCRTNWIDSKLLISCTISKMGTDTREIDILHNNKNRTEEDKQNIYERELNTPK